MFSTNGYKRGTNLDWRNIVHLNLFYHPKTSAYYRKIYTKEVLDITNIPNWLAHPYQTKENAELVSGICEPDMSAFGIPIRLRTARIWSRAISDFFSELWCIPEEYITEVLDSMKNNEEFVWYCTNIFVHYRLPDDCSTITHISKFLEKRGMFKYYLCRLRRNLNSLW